MNRRSFLSSLLVAPLAPKALAHCLDANPLPSAPLILPISKRAQSWIFYDWDRELKGYTTLLFTDYRPAAIVGHILLPGARWFDFQFLAMGLDPAVRSYVASNDWIMIDRSWDQRPSGRVELRLKWRRFQKNICRPSLD